MSDLAKVGDRIEHGQDIPANVVELRDSAAQEGGRPWFWRRDGDGFRMSWDRDDPAPGPARTPEDLRKMFPSRWPMTVVEVDPEPQPACWKCGLTIGDVVDRGVNSYADGRLRFMHAYGECPTADQLVQPAEPVETTSRCQVAQRCLKGMCAPDDECPSDPVLSGPGDREPDEREVADTHLMMVLGVDRLDGVIPAIESLLADRKTLMLVEAELGVRPEDVFAEIRDLQGLRTAGAIDREILDRVADLLDVGHNEDVIGRLQYRLGEGSQQPAESGPLVLTLPQPPEGTVALVGALTKARYTPLSGRWWSPNGVGWTYSEMLGHEGSVTVEMAPPREPRVWPKLDPVPSEVRTVQIIGGPNHSEVWARAEGQTLFHRTDDTDVVASLAELRELGEVREVLDNG